MDWDKIREQFPVTKKYTYVNSAEASPISKLASQEGKKFYDEMLSKGDIVFEEWLKRREEVRKKLAKFINANKNEISFTLNTSHGMDLIAEILQGKGEVITMDDEFPSSTFSWLNRGYKVHFMKPKKAIFQLRILKRK